MGIVVKSRAGGRVDGKEEEKEDSAPEESTGADTGRRGTKPSGSGTVDRLGGGDSTGDGGARS